MPSSVFPKKFLWGTATSAHQVEGNNSLNDWSEWERSATRMDALRRDGKDPEDFISGRACDHFNRFGSDLDLAKSLGTNAYRFSLEWSRIEPEEGKFDEKAIAHYRQVLRSLRDRKLEPFVTLWHFTNPLWFARLGGWENPEAVFYFNRFALRAMQEFGGHATYWITFNEPTLWAWFSYGIGIWPPQHASAITQSLIVGALANAHNAVYESSKERYPHFRVGSANLITPVMYREWWQRPLAHMIGTARNESFLRRTHTHHDFLGIHYYHAQYFEIVPRQLIPPLFAKGPWGSVFGFPEVGSVKNDMGWGIWPEGMYHAVKSVAKFGKPIYITENGTADADDDHRSDFIRDNLRWLKKAIDEGIDVRGYFHWSLLDNFEWAGGFTPRFGLFETDYRTLERRKRPSADVYAGIVKRNTLP